MVKHTVFPCYMLDVEIRLQNTVYNAQEGDGSITICAEIFEGSLGRDVSVNFLTADGTAQGTYSESQVNSICN